MAERLTFTLSGRDELSRVLNGTGDAADRLRLRLSGIAAGADGSLRDLQGRFLSVADAQARLTNTTDGTSDAFRRLREAGGQVGESLRANLISLAPAAIPAVAGLASSAAVLAGQLGAVGVAASAYTLALAPQIGKIGEAAEAQTKYEEAVAASGRGSQEALKAQAEYQRLLAAMPPATREAAVAVGLLKDNFQEWSDSLSGDVMAPFTKGVAVANALLPETTGLVKGTSAQFDRLITLVAGGMASPGFDALNQRFTNFAEKTLRDAVDGLTVFLAKLDSGEVGGGRLEQWWDYAQQAGPAVAETLENVADAVLNILEAGSGIGVGMLDVVNFLTGIVSAVPPEAIAALLQMAIAIKAVKLAAVGMTAAQAGVAALGLQIAAMRTAASGAPGALAGTTAAIGGLSKAAKVAMAGTGIGLLLITLSELSSASQQPKPDVDKLSASLTQLAQSGKVSGEALRAWGSDLGGLSDALTKVIDPEGLDQVQQSVMSFFGMDSTPVKNAKEDVKAFDEALAGMVSGGRADLAAEALDRVIAKMRDQGLSAGEVRGKLTEYKDALAGQRLEQELAAQSMGIFGEQALEVQGKLDAQKASADGLRQSIVALNDVNRAGLGGMIGFEAAIDAATKAAAENAGVLDMQGGKLTLSTEKQRAAAQALTDLAAKTDEATGAARESGASWNEVNGIYERGRQQLVKSAMQMGLTRAEAKALADQILKTPDKTAKLRGNMEDLETKLARAKAQLKSVPDSRKAQVRAEIYQLEQAITKARRELDAIDGKTSHTYVITHLQARREGAHGTELGYAQGGPIRGYASGGPIPGYPGGGLLRGPGTPTSDSILMWGSTGEFMIRAAAVEKYGEKLFHDLNSMRVPVGRSASPGLAAAPPVAAPAAGGEQPAVTYNVYPRASVISVEDLRLLQRQEEARQRVGRPR